MRRSTLAFLALLGLSLLASLACGFGDFLADEAPETASIDEIPLPDQLATILLEKYDLDTALGAIFAALERGYSYPQLAAAIDGGTLQADGHVDGGDGGLLAPAGSPAGVIDLSDLEASRHDLRRAKSPADTRELIVMEALIEQVKEQFQVETEEEMAQRIIELYARGYTAAQITEAIMFDELQLGIGGFGESVCIFLMTTDGEAVLPEADGYLDNVACTEGVDRLRQATADAAEAADASPAEPDASAPAPVGDTDGLAGTYLGTSDYPDTLYRAWETEPGEAALFPVTGHDVSITIGPDGAVSGNWLLAFSGVYDPDHVWIGTPCPGQMDLTISGTFHGQITDENQTLELTEFWTCDMNFSCDMLNVCTDEPIGWEFDVQVANGMLTARTLPLSSDESGGFIWTISAARQ